MNSQVINETRDALKINTAVEKIPNAIPVIEVGVKSVKNLIIKALDKSSAASSTIYTTPSNQDFYIVGAQLSRIKDAACDSSSVTLSAVIGGATSTILTLAGFTLTAQDGSITICFTHPIKVDRGSTITLYNGTKTVGNILTSGVIYGFLDEASNA